jgi:glycosyltransferase involved in cell wall biosynthesis
MLADVDLGRADATRTHVTEIAQGFAREGRLVELIARGPDPRLPGVRFHPVGGGRPGNLRRIVRMNRTALRVLLRCRGNCKLVYYRYDSGLVGAVIASRLLGYHAVAEMNDVRFGADYPGRTDGLRGRLRDLGKVSEMRAAARVTSRFVTVTSGIKQIIVHRYSVAEDRVQVLPNGVDVDRFQVLERRSACQRAGLDPAGRYVVFVGLLAGWVDFPVLLRAFALVAADRPDARLVIVGDGPERRLVESLRDDLGVGDRVVLTGFVPDRDLVSQYIGASTVCVMAHRAAVLDRIGVSPVKLAEYLAAGRAVVGLHIPGASEVLETSGGGVSVPPDPIAMAEAIGELLDDPERADALGRAGRLAAEGMYSWSSVVRRTLDLIDDAA